MKKSIILAFVLFVSAISFSQEIEEKYPQDFNKKNELKVNAFSLIAFSSLNVTYERLLNKNTSFGVDFFYNIDDVTNGLFFTKKSSLTPYFRYYSSETKFARGFFVEGFGMFSNYMDNDLLDVSSAEDKTNFALGVSLGGKFVTKHGFIIEIYLGAGRNLINKDDYNLITRGGVSLGYRF